MDKAESQEGERQVALSERLGRIVSHGHLLHVTGSFDTSFKASLNGSCKDSLTDPYNAQTRKATLTLNPHGFYEDFWFWYLGGQMVAPGARNCEPDIRATSPKIL